MSRKGRPFRAIACGGALAAVLGISACSSSSSTSHAAATSNSIATAASELRIGMVNKQLSNPFFSAIATGAQAAAKKYNIHITIAAAQDISDVSGQVNSLNSMISAGDNCFIADPVSGTNLIGSLVHPSRAGDPIINVDEVMDASAAKASGVKITTYLGTVNYDAGEAAGNLILKYLPKGADVAILGGVAGEVGALERPDGMRAAVKGKLNVVSFESTDTSILQGEQFTAAWIRGFPHLRGVLTIGGDLALGAQRAVDAAHKQNQIKVVGVDGILPQLQEVESGTMVAAIEQFPYIMGYQAVEACLAAKLGMTVPSNVPTDTLAVTKANASAAVASYPAPPKGVTISDPFAAFLAEKAK